MRLADYVVQFLKARGIDDAFTVCGGGSIFLNDALAKGVMRYVSCHHEQAAAMAAEAYARVRNGLGLVVVTSGPGGTNAITGVAGAWTDHVSVVVLSGQVFSTQTIGDSDLRTKGVQEINIVPMVKHITKYAVQVRDPAKIRFHLEKAVHLARSGRPGPVWLDLPADTQKAEIDPKHLAGFVPLEPKPWPSLPGAIDKVVRLLLRAKRPLVHIGQGVRIAGAQEVIFDLLAKLKAPMVTARNGADLIDSDHELYVGRPGTFAQRGANFAVQTSDLYIAIGTRLSLAQTGYNAKDYARRAKVVMVDIDRSELEKGTVPIHLKVQADARDFIEQLLGALEGRRLPDWSQWLARCKAWQAKYPPVTADQLAA